MAGGGMFQNYNPSGLQLAGAPVAKKPATPLSLYGDAVNTQGSDYDNLMKQFDELYSKSNAPQVNYQSSPDVTSALSGYKNFADTGGYSANDINSLRERSISPIRSVYANAKMNLDRQKALQGGYSPGYGAAVTRMARDQSGQLSQATNNANAGIAQMINSGKLSGLNGLGNLAESEAGRTYDASKTNATLMDSNKNRMLDILKSKNSLYGTSPALVNTFGNQALSTAQMNQNQNQFNTRTDQTNNLAKLTAAGRL